MALNGMLSWNHTKQALSKIKDRFKCHSCAKFATSPVTLGGCEHIFCSTCCEAYLGVKCLVCSIPAPVKDAAVDRQLLTLALLCQRLQVVLGGDEIGADMHQSEVSDDLHIQCTPNQPIPRPIAGGLVPLSTASTNIEQPTTDATNPDNTTNAKPIINKDDHADDQDKMSTENAGTKGRKRRIAGTKSGKAGKTSIFTACMPVGQDVTENPVAVGKKRKREPAPEMNDDESSDRHARSELTDTDSADQRGAKSRPEITKLEGQGKVDSGENERKSETKESKRNTRKSLPVKVDGIVKIQSFSPTMKQSSTIKRRKSLPANQSTLTQFYDYDEEIDSDDNGIVNVDVKTTAPKKENKHQEENDPKVETRKKGFTDKTIKAAKKIARTGKNSSTPKTRVRGKNKQGETSTSKVSMTSGDNENVTPSKHSKDKENAAQKGDQNKNSSSTKKGKKNDIHETPTAKNNRNSTKSSNIQDSPVTSVKQKANGSSCTTPNTPRQRGISRLKAVRVGSPGLERRNAKGETPLQVAAIKNDVERVRALLKQGANPNVRDHAGWTPLHEACNHGYVEIAGLLLDRGAMVSVPGLENDTPLHDAINNNRLECVKLLVARGASLTLRNMHGQTPHDLARTEAMRAALQTPVKVNDILHPPEPIDPVEFQPPCILGTGLSREDKQQLKKAAATLHVKLSDEVTPEVTHIVTKCNKDGQSPRTIKVVQGILTGKWILNFEWLETSLQLGSLVCEEAFEVPGTSLFPNTHAPSAGRNNRKLQLPGLFNGCKFYFHGSFEYAQPSKEDLINIIQAGGGAILNREPKPGHLDDVTVTVPYHADVKSELAHCSVYVIHEPHADITPIRTKTMCSVVSSWIMDCAANFKLIPLPSV